MKSGIINRELVYKTEVEEMNYEEPYDNEDVIFNGALNPSPINTLSIEYLEGILEEMKINGANRVSINLNEDHNSYYFYGFKYSK